MNPGAGAGRFPFLVTSNLELRRHPVTPRVASPDAVGKELTMVTIRNERPTDVVAREALLDRAYGLTRFTKTSERLREGRRPADELAFVATERGRVVGTVRLWRVCAGAGRPALLLGPLAVDPKDRNRGIGAKLMRHAIATACRLGHRAVLLVGDVSYYGRFGFSAEKTATLWMPGRYEVERLLALEVAPGALDGARGVIGAAGELAPKPDLKALVAAVEGGHRDVMPRAA
jgi:predicted N-acetyltransferase YhbS